MLGFASIGELALGEIPDDAGTAPTAESNSKGPPSAIGQFALGQQDDGNVGTVTTLLAEAAAINFTGQATTFPIIFVAEGTGLSFTGQIAPLDRSMPAEPATVGFTGQETLFAINFNAENGNLTVTGQGVDLAVSLSALPADVQFGGQDATFTIVLDAQAGTMTITGQEVSLTALIPTEIREALMTKRSGRPTTYWRGRN